MSEKLKTFWLLESIGGLSWVYMYVVWILGFEPAMFLIVPLAVSAILLSSAALIYAVAGKLDRKFVPLAAVVAGNFWVIADSLWAVNDFNGVEIFLTIARVFSVLLAVVATWEFAASKDNVEKLATFAGFFRKFKSS